MRQQKAHSAVRQLKALSLTVVIAMPLVAPVTVHAQADEPLEEIVVHGIRQSLDTAAAIKRNSDNIVDAITAEDIGLFSDNNIGEALQRIPGVQLERSDSEGTRISIRGLGPRFVRTTLNGRTALSSPGGENGTDARGFSFNVIPSEIITRATVHKSSQATDVEGAIGGAVDLQTTRPLDFAADREQSFYMGGSLRGTQSDLEDEDAWRGTLFLNKTWGDTFGIAFATAIETRDLVSHSVETQDLDTKDFRILEGTPINGQPMTEAFCDSLELSWNSGRADCDFRVGAVFDGYRNQYTTTDRDRETYTAAIQWQPTDNLEIYTDWTSATEDRYYEIYRDRRRTETVLNRLDDGDSPTTITDIAISLDDANEFTDGVVTAFSYLNNTEADRMRSQYDNGHLVNWIDGDIGVGGINLKWSNDDWTISGDIGYASHEQVRLQWSMAGELDFSPLNDPARFPNWDRDETEALIPFVGVNGSFDLSSGFPIILFEDVNGVPVDATTLDDIIFKTDRQQLYLEDTSETSFRLDFENELDDRDDGDLISFFNNIKFGFVYRERDGSRNLLRTEAVADVRIERGGADFEDIAMAPFGMITVTDFMNDINVPGFNNTYVVPDIFAWAAADPTGTFSKDPYDGTVRQDQDYNIYEDITAAYLQLGFSGQGRFPYRGNIGLRYADTEQSSTGYVGIQEGQDFTPLDPLNPIRTSYREYDDWLPSANIAFDFTDRTVFRLAYSRTVARPDPVDLRQGWDLDEDVLDAADNAGDRDGSSGNPDLDRYLTDNYDMSLEWYPESGGAYALGLFYKKLDGFIAPGQELVDIDLSPFDPTNEELGVVTYVIDRPVNTEGGDIKGVEVSMHLPFDTFTQGFFSGFGITSSVTYVDAELDAVRDAGQPIELRGTSEWSGNFVTYYENGPFGIRVAYNYREDFLHQEAESPNDFDEYTLGGEFLDMNIDYRIGDNWRIRFTANNLTDTQRERVYRAEVNDYFNRQQDAGRTYVLEVRGSLGND
jgi:iron complex outermembrane receptor protein